LWNKRTMADIKSAISYFNQAIDKDPGYALAYSGLADAYSTLPAYGGDPREFMPKSSAAALKALELDPTLGHPHAVLASSKFDYDWDFAGGEAEYKKAIALDPSDATAHQWFSLDLSSIGRTQEAADEATRAYQLDPLSPVMRITQMVAYVAARRFDQAIEIGKATVADNPTLGQTHVVIAIAYWGQHKYPQMIQELKTGAELGGDKNSAEQAAALEDGFQSGGWPSALRKAIEVSLAQRKAKSGYVSPYNIATLYAGIEAKDDAFQWLDTAYEERDTGILALRTDFSLDGLRSDPRYAELLRKVGLPH